MMEHRSVARWQIDRKVKVRFGDEKDFIDCQIEDINFRGLKIFLKRELEKDVNLKLTLLMSEDFTLDVEAWVVWRRSVAEFSVYGLYFTKIKDSDKEKIYKFVYKYVPQGLHKKWWQDLEEICGFPSFVCSGSKGECSILA